MFCRRGGTECNGCMKCYGEEITEHRCPICGGALEYDSKVYTCGGDVIGCENCVTVKDAEAVFV